MEKTWEELDDDFEESVAILIYDAKYSSYNAEQTAAQTLGFKNKSDLKAHVQKLKAERHNV